MTVLILSFVVWGLVVFMAADEYCRENEKRSFQFLFAIAVVLTAIGLWSFEVHQFREVSLHDWVLLGFLPIGLLYIRLKMGLVKKQAEAVGRVVSLVELNLEAVPDKGLVKRFKLLSAGMWAYAALVLVVHLWGKAGVSI